MKQDHTIDMYDLEFQAVCLPFIFKINFKVHVIYSEISEILTIENITIDTKIKLIACNQPERNKVIQ